MNEPGPTSATLRALGTTALVAVRRPGSLDRARAALEAELYAVDRACSRFRDDSELVHLNRTGGDPVVIGPYLLAALEVAVTAAEATDGAVDPTVGKAVRLAGYKQPHEYRFVASLPRTANGKLQRSVLVSRLRDQ